MTDEQKQRRQQLQQQVAKRTPGINENYARELMELHGDAVEIGQLRIPLDERMSALVPYRGPKGMFRYISATDVIHAKVPVEELKDTTASVYFVPWGPKRS